MWVIKWLLAMILKVTLIKTFCRVLWDVLGHPCDLKHPSWQHYYELYENNYIDVKFCQNKHATKKVWRGAQGPRILDTSSPYYSLLYTNVDYPTTSNKHFKERMRKSGEKLWFYNIVFLISKSFWKLVKFPHGKNTLGCKWVFKNKGKKMTNHLV